LADGGTQISIFGKGKSNKLIKAKFRIGYPDDQKWQTTTHYKNRKKNTPKQKNLAIFFRQCLEYMGIDNSIINAANNLKQSQTDNYNNKMPNHIDDNTG
jgi:hypothetical protein